MLLKLKDSRSFTILFSMGDSNNINALLDSEVSIILMPLNIYMKLGLGKLDETSITLQLIDESIKYH